MIPERALTLGLLLLGLFLAGCRPASATALPTPEPPPPGYETEYRVEEAFVPFYLGHWRVTGEPISGPLELRGRLVQYFRAGRLELVPENPPGWEVGLAYLGEEACGRQPPLHYSDVPSRLDRHRRYYPETGHSLGGGFLEFVSANGGTDVFGPPISEERRAGTETVQDFLRVQLRRGADGEFALTPLGEVVLSGGAPPPGLCPSVPADDPDAEAGQADGGEDDGQALVEE